MSRYALTMIFTYAILGVCGSIVAGVIDSSWLTGVIFGTCFFLAILMAVAIVTVADTLAGKILGWKKVQK